MKKLLSLLLVATIITSTLCVSYFAFDNVDNLSNITTSEPTEKEIETSTISTSDEATSDEAKPDEATTDEITTETSTEPSSSISTPDELTRLVTSIKLNRSKVTIDKGRSIRLLATVTPNDADNKALTCKSSNTNIATVNNNGYVKAIKTGKATIIVSSSDGSNITAKCDITVVQKATKVTVRQYYHINKPSKKLYKLNAKVYPSDTTDKSLIYRSSNNKVATVNKKGQIKAKKYGKTTITVINKKSIKSAKCLLIVGQYVSKIKLSKNKVTLNNGKATKLKSKVTNKAIYKAIQWKSTNTNIAKVNSNGVVKALKRGTCYVIAVAKDGSRKSAKCKVTVRQLVTKLSYNKKTQKAEVYKNKTIKFAVTVAPSNANNKGLTYSSSNKKVATVNSKGVVKGIKAGTVTITAKAKDGSRKAVKLTVKVKNPPISDNTKLTIKQLKSKSIVKRHCDMLNNYFKSCGATIEPRLKGQHQWYVEDTSNYCVDNFTSLNDWYIETLSYWIQEMSTDTLKNDGEWNGYTDMNKWEKEVLDSFIYWDKNGYPKYRKNLILDSKYNGFDWVVNTETPKDSKFLVYVDFEKFKINGKDYKDNKGNQEYVIKFYYNWQSIEDYNNHKDPRD